MSEVSSSDHSEFRSGWRNLASATIGMAFGIPAYTAISSFFFQAVRTEFGWSSAATAGALVALPITAAVLPLAGRLADRFGVRIVSGASMLMLALSFAWLSRLGGSVREYYTALIVLNVFGCATGPVSYTRLIVASFKHARGMALAIAQFGIALVTVVLPPVLAIVIATQGWREAYLLLAGGAVAGGLAAQALMWSGGVRSALDNSGDGMTPRSAIKSRDFWALGGAVLLVSAGSLGLVTQLQSVLLDRGVGLRTGGWLLSLLALAVLLSRIGMGWLLDRRRPERWSALVLVVAAVGPLVMLLAGGRLPVIGAGILLFGCSIGAELDLLSFFCARQFGPRHYSAVYGLLSIFFYLGMAAGGVLYGLVKDLSGGYGLAMAGSSLLLLGSAALFRFIRQPQKELCQR